MAELAIKVGSVSPDPAHYQDGDIIEAFNSRAIRCCHAWHICHPKLAGGGKGVPRNPAHVAKDFFEHTHQYRLDRISRTEVRKTRLSDSSEIVIVHGQPHVDFDGRVKIFHMDYIARRLASNKHKIFGAPGFEFWYGGHIDVSDAKLNLVWTAIETKTPMREIDHQRWPASVRDLRDNLFILVDDFDDSEMNNLVAPERDERNPGNQITLRKRKRYVDWRDEVPAQEHANIEDKTKVVDIRESVGVRPRGTAVKTRPNRIIVAG